MNTSVMFSSVTDLWATPQAFFDSLNKEFDFTLDPCCNEENRKCPEYITKERDGLKHTWTGRVFMNPPYGRVIGGWVKKAHDEAASGNVEVVVGLLPARVDTKWFHDYIYGKAEVRFVRGRLKFGDAESNAPFPSMVCIWKGNISNGAKSLER